MLKAFNQVTLNDNWYEERAPPLKGVIADYGVDQFEKTPAETFKKEFTGETRAITQQKLHMARKGGAQMLNQRTMALLEKPYVVSTDSGIGTILPEHSGDVNERHLMTSSQANFGKGKRETTTTKRKLRMPNAPQCGGPGGATPAKGISSSGPGEVFVQGRDAQRNTASQRSWMYGKDPGITAKLNPPKDAPRPDGVSLAIGVAERKYDGNKSYARSTNITTETY